MENVFEMLVVKLLEVGFYDLLLFIISLSMFYALLKKSKFFDSEVVNAALASSIAFLIFGFPVIMNYSITLPLVKFFTQSFVWLLMFLFGFLMASYFYPDLPKFLAEHFSSRSMLTVGIVGGLLISITSGTISILWAANPIQQSIEPHLPWETSSMSAAIIVFVIFIIAAGSISLRAG
jgi:hypothetical protein